MRNDCMTPIMILLPCVRSRVLKMKRSSHRQHKYKGSSVMHTSRSSPRRRCNHSANSVVDTASRCPYTLLTYQVETWCISSVRCRDGRRKNDARGLTKNMGWYDKILEP